MFTPDPIDLEEYEVAHAAGRTIWFGQLPTDESQATIEDAIQRALGCAENVTVYWPILQRKPPGQKHVGWCHILVQTYAMRKIVRDNLDNLKVTRRSEVSKIQRPFKPIEGFERITIIGEGREVDLNIRGRSKIVKREHIAFVEEATIIAEDAEALSQENSAFAIEAAAFAEAASALSQKNTDFANRAAAFARDVAGRL
ncbi:hypothetical protein GGR58DRAFT_487519 [Xylaria digitata]|nr:hypothetical protein GGR58DRAFT_487519 [Xylaria digitata]